MTDGKPTVGLIGIGNIGFPFGASVLDAGYDLVCSKRGRSDELVAKGATIPGEGTPREVAEAADVLLTCLPNPPAFDAAMDGADGVLAAADAPVVIELSTVSIPRMEAVQEQLAGKGGSLLDCPVSGTPPMAAEKKAVVFASGDKAVYDEVAEVIAAFAPMNVFVGELGAGTNFKYVANLLAFVHVTAAAEAMAFAAAAGLNLQQVAGVISKAEGATSGQFNIRAPMMASGDFGETPMVTVDVMRAVTDQIVAHADEIGAATPLTTAVRDLYEEFAAAGEGASDPGKLSVYLQEKAAKKG